MNPTPSIDPEDAQPVAEQLIDGYRLVLTCPSCPEQYDMFEGETQVAYLRLRHGAFRVDSPDCGDTTILTMHPEGSGQFMPEERERFLKLAIESVRRYRSALEEIESKSRANDIGEPTAVLTDEALSEKLRELARSSQDAELTVHLIAAASRIQTLARIKDNLEFAIRAHPNLDKLISNA